MKRISLLSILALLIVSVTAESRDYSYVPVRYRVRWSVRKQGLVSGDVYYTPYALTYGNNSIIEGEIDYSPYAFKYGNNGLVDENLGHSPYAFQYGSNGLVDRNVRYTPYAFSYNNSGLVSDISSSYRRKYRRSPEINVIIGNTTSGLNYNKTESFAAYAERVNTRKVATRKAKLEEQKVHIEEIIQEKANDPSETIRQFLKSKNINFRTSRSLRIDRKTISVDFILEDEKIIKFWNSKEISNLENSADYKKKCYENYVESWKEYCVNSIDNDQNMYHIVSADKEDILAQLAMCDYLKTEKNMYALVQNESSSSTNQ